MKRVLASIALLYAAFAVTFAQNMAEATEIAQSANESLTAGDYQSALDGFRKALAIADAAGENGAALASVCKGVIPKTLIALAKQKIMNNLPDGALADISEAARLAAANGDSQTAENAKALIPQAYMKKGMALLNNKSFDAAAEAYGKALEADPDNGLAALRYGMALEGADRTEAAIKAYSLAAENGQEKNAHAQLGKFYIKRALENLKSKNLAQAVEDATVSYSYVANPQALQIAGQASHLLGKSADAISFFEKYLEAAPAAANAGQIAYTVGALYQQSGSLEKAREYFSKAASDAKYGADAKKALDALK